MKTFKKKLGVLLLFQLLLAAGLWAADYHHRSSSSQAVSLSEFETDLVDKITLKQGDEQIELVKEDGVWTVPDFHQMNADPIKVSNLLKDLDALESRERIGRTENSHERFEVSSENPNTELIVQEGDKIMAHLLVGKSPTFGKRYIRTADSPEVYSVDWAGFGLNSDPESWFDRTLLRVKNPASISVDDWSIEKVDGKWIFEGEELDSEKLVPALNVLKNLRVTGVADRQPQPGQVVNVTSEEGDLYRFNFFEADDQQFVSREDQKLVFTLGKGAAKNLLEAEPGEFLKEDEKDS